MGRGRRFWSIAGYLIILAWCLAPGASGATRALQLNPPTGFGGTALSETEIQWQWDRDAGASRYFLEDDQGGLIAEILEEGDDPVTFTESGFTAGTEVCRQVRSVADFGATISDPAGPICVTTLGGLEPPTDFSGTVLSDSEIEWTWTDTVGEDGYELQDQSGNVIISGITSNSTSVCEIGLSPGTTVTRQVVAFAGNVTAASNLDTRTTFTITTTNQGAPKVTASGPLCLKVGETKEYVAKGTPGKGTYAWTITKGAAFIEPLQDADKPTVKVTGKDPGEVELSVKYTTTKGSDDATVQFCVVAGDLEIPIHVHLLADDKGVRKAKLTEADVTKLVEDANKILEKACVKLTICATTTDNLKPGNGILSRSVTVATDGADSFCFQQIRNDVPPVKKKIDAYFSKKVHPVNGTTSSPGGGGGASSSVLLEDTSSARTLAHEFGHVMGQPNIRKDPKKSKNLMYTPAPPTATDLDFQQVKDMRKKAEEIIMDLANE